MEQQLTGTIDEGASRSAPSPSTIGKRPLKVDLRSDTVTLPTQEMLTAITRAPLGDDMRERDPTVVELEALAARMTGTEAGLFVTSGTMGNLVAMLAHTGRGGDVLVDPEAHLMRSEVAGVVHVAGLFPRHYPVHRGFPVLEALPGMLRPRSTRSGFATALVCIETSHNNAGGTVMPLKDMAELHAMTKAAGVPVHIDGARLFNAAVALGVPASEIVRHADSVTFCISKGLSAPFGSLVCGSAEFIERARLFRRMIGGAMRQGGVVAAAGVVALSTMVERLADDHRRAQIIARGLHALDARLVDLAEVETNIVMADIGHTSLTVNEWVERLAALDIDVRSYGKTRLRMVTHRHIDDDGAYDVVDGFRQVLEAARTTVS
jgi:threonine aldolase